MEEEKKNKTLTQKIVTGIGIALIVVLVPMLVFNLIIIVKGIGADDPPKLFGTTPLVVLTSSMEDNKNDEWEDLSFPRGCMIFIVDTPFEELKVGDVITYKEGNSLTTHRIVGEGEDSKGKYFLTKGDANNIGDQDAGRPNIYKEDYYGQYKGAHILGFGYFSDFVQKPVGILVVVGVPVIAFIVYDVLTRRKEAKQKQAAAVGQANAKAAEVNAELEAMRKELEALKAKSNDSSDDNSQNNG